VRYGPTLPKINVPGLVPTRSLTVRCLPYTPAENLTQPGAQNPVRSMSTRTKMVTVSRILSVVPGQNSTPIYQQNLVSPSSMMPQLRSLRL